jgi:4-hydroxy-3-methylbut-2-enyl diphosphate reductase IspH
MLRHGIHAFGRLKKKYREALKKLAQAIDATCTDPTQLKMKVRFRFHC